MLTTLLGALLLTSSATAGDLKKRDIRRCQQDDVSACAALTYLWQSESPSSAEAGEALGASCQAGVLVACDLIALSDPAMEPSAESLHRSCQAGIAAGCIPLIANTIDYGGTLDFPLASQQAATLCDLDVGDACALLGRFHEEGKSFTDSASKAASYYRQACDMSSQEGCYRLGLLRRDGRGITQSDAEATALLGGACEAGHADACEAISATVADEDVLAGCGAGNQALCLRAARALEPGDTNGLDALLHLVSASSLTEALWQSGDEAIAAALLSRACQRSDAGSCNLHGRILAAAGDLDAAYEALQAACEGGSAPGCSASAVMTLNRAEDDVASLASLQQIDALCDPSSGSVEVHSCALKAALAEAGAATLNGGTEAAELLYQLSCEGGNATSCARLSCDEGDARGCAMAAADFLFEPLWLQDSTIALTLSDKACAADEPSGCYLAALIHHQGFGLAPNHALAIRDYSRACEGGVPSACGMLAVLHQERGQHAAAEAAFQAGCALGSPTACTGLAHIRYDAEDYTSARTLFHQACTDGAALGCYYLAFMHQNGEGGEKAEISATHYFRDACEGGFAPACEALQHPNHQPIRHQPEFSSWDPHESAAE